MFEKKLFNFVAKTHTNTIFLFIIFVLFYV